MSKKLDKNNVNILIALGSITSAVAVATLSAKNLKNKSKTSTNLTKNISNEDSQVYFIGGGLASLAGAAYLTRDCNLKGENIHIIEGMKVLGGSTDGSGDSTNSFLCRGGRMLEICPVTPYKKNPKILKEALKTSFR